MSNGGTVYYGDELTITYTADTGYKISSKGITSVTVKSDVTSSDIYATVTAESYTYNIVYQSANGPTLGTSTATYSYGTTNTISPKSFDGYVTPSSQTVDWDSTTAKTITFIYYQGDIVSETHSGTISSSPKITYTASIQTRNRKEYSVEIRLTWTATIAAGSHNSNGQAVRLTAGGVSTDTTIVAWNTWGSSSSSARSVTVTSEWITVPVSSASTKYIDVYIYYYKFNSVGTDLTAAGISTGANYTWTVDIGVY